MHTLPDWHPLSIAQRRIEEIVGSLSDAQKEQLQQVLVQFIKDLKNK